MSFLGRGVWVNNLTPQARSRNVRRVFWRMQESIALYIRTIFVLFYDELFLLILVFITYDNGSGIAIEVVQPCHRKSEHVRYYINGMF